MNYFEKSSFACLQIPMSYELGIEIPLDNRWLINRAHRRNVAVLIDLGCDCIITDDPLLLKFVLEEYRSGTA